MCKPIVKIREGEWSKEVGALAWSDVWGPTPIETLGGRRYYVTFTDDHSRKLTYLCTLRQKSETFSAYQQFEAWLDHQLAAKIHMLHLDQGGEYTGNEFVMYLKRQGTVQRLMAHDTPQHNGVAERLNRTILKWSECCSTRADCQNFCGERLYVMSCGSRTEHLPRFLMA